MNTLKIQQEILKAVLANPENVKMFPLETNGEDCTFVTITGAVGYVLSQDDLRVRLTGANYMAALDLDDVIKPGNMLQGTDEYRRGGTARRYEKLTAGEDPVYVDTSLLKHFDSPVLFQEPKNPRGMIVVAEEPWEDGKLYVRGVVMPVKMDEHETDDDWTK